MNETVWFLSAVINGRFSVTSIIAANEHIAVDQALDYLNCTVLVPLNDMAPLRIITQSGPTDSFTITSDCFVASLIKS